MDVAVATCITKDSLRPSKRLRSSEVTPAQDNGKEEEGIQNMCDEQIQDDNLAEDKPRQKRNWECWEANDVDCFFEALSEYGKDFDKIHRHMKHKMGSDAKNKDQIRFYYYRTWNKISKHLAGQLEKERRAANELYILVCYGELRKKGMVGFGKKQMDKLSELLNQKWTMVRYRGRNIKLKPPNCKALKKLLELDTVKEKVVPRVVIPRNLTVELVPGSNATWCAVQKSACNPRLRFVVVDPKMTLGTITDALKKKLRSPLNEAEIDNVLVFPLRSEGINHQILAEHYQVLQSNVPSHNGVSNQGTNNKRGKKSMETTVLINGPCPQVETVATSQSGMKSENEKPIVNLNGSLFFPGSIIFATSKGKEYSSSSVGQDQQAEDEHSRRNLLDWSAPTCTQLTVGTLYLALGKPEVLRFKYCFEKEDCLISRSQTEERDNGHCIASVQRFLSVVTADYKQALTPSKRSKMIKRVISPKTAPNSNSFVPICPSTSATTPVTQSIAAPTTSPEIMLPPKEINLPALRKRGRNPYTRSVNIVRRKLIPKPLNMSGTKTLVPGAVAVNIVPQPAQLVQFAQVPAVSAQLMNSGNAATAPVVMVTANSCVSQSKTTTSSPDLLSKAVAQSLQGINTRVQVLDEGFFHQPTKPSTSSSLEINQLMQVQDSNSATGWSTMLSDMDLSFLQNNNSSQDYIVKQSSQNHLAKLSTEITTSLGQSEAIPGDVATTSVTFSSTFVHSDNPSASFSSLCLVTEMLSSTSPTLTLTSAMNTQPKLSVLTTPLKDNLRTPTKTDSATRDSICVMRVPSPAFESNSWLTNDVGEISIGGLIGEISKEPEPKITLGNTLSNNSVAPALDCIIDENSVDFVNRFKDLTAKMAGSTEQGPCPESSKRALTFKEDSVSSGISAVDPGSYGPIIDGPSALTQNAKDIPMPIYHAEESTGPLDGLSFVLPTTDGGNSMDSVKGFPVGQ